MITPQALETERGEWFYNPGDHVSITGRPFSSNWVTILQPLMAAYWWRLSVLLFSRNYRIYLYLVGSGHCLFEKGYFKSDNLPMAFGRHPKAKDCWKKLSPFPINIIIIIFNSRSANRVEPRRNLLLLISACSVEQRPTCSSSRTLCFLLYQFFSCCC